MVERRYRRAFRVVRIPYKPEFFSVYLFATAKVVYITAIIFLHIIVHSAVHTYDFQIFIIFKILKSGTKTAGELERERERAFFAFSPFFTARSLGLLVYTDREPCTGYYTLEISCNEETFHMTLIIRSPLHRVFCCTTPHA